MHAATKTYRPEIDGLRALAVLAVVFYHADITVAGYTLFPGGFLGVDVFFVISGYLITNILLRELERNNFSFISFYERRARRILPPLFLVMGITIPAAWLCLLPGAFKEYAQSLMATAAFSSNFLFWQQSGYFDQQGELRPLLHTWSLSVEEQFYVFFPVMLILIWKISKKTIPWFLVMTLMASLALADWLSRIEPDAAFFLLPSRMWELMAGALLAWAEPRRKRENPVLEMSAGIVGLMLIVAPMILWGPETRHPSLMTLLPVVGSMTVIWFTGGRRDPASLLLVSRPAVGLGLISYSVYLWHQPLFAFARAAKVREVEQWLYLVMICASIALGWMTWRLVETPFRNRARISSAALWRCVWAGMLSFLILGFAGHIKNGVPERYSGEKATVLKQAFETKILEQSGRPCHSRTVEDACLFEGRSDYPIWYVVGDSHAGSLLSSLYGRIRKIGHGFSPLVRNGCFYVSKNFTDSKRCPADYQIARWEKLQSSPPGVVVFHGRIARALAGTGFDNGEGGVEKAKDDMAKVDAATVTASIQDLLSKGHRVIIIYPVPEVGWHVPDTFMKLLPEDDKERDSWFKQGGITTSWETFRLRTKSAYDAYDAAGESPHIIRIYPERIFCNTQIPGRCITHAGLNLYYSDDDHLSASGAEKLVEEIMQEVHEKWGF